MIKVNGIEKREIYGIKNAFYNCVFWEMLYNDAAEREGVVSRANKTVMGAEEVQILWMGGRVVDKHGLAYE